MGGWQFYGGDDRAPDYNAPITAATEIVVPQWQYTYIWAVNDSVPADTPAGPHSLIITVTSTTPPALTTWDTVLLWVGDWVAPPPPGETHHWIYLPLVLR